MILLSTKHPQNSVYYLGSILLGIINSNSNNNLGVYNYFELLNEVQEVSMNRFLLILDWLYMLGKIDLDIGKGLKLCI
ncbi:ABC-three component system middle component 6 [Acinetobacter pullicarnis]|uniref:ABC-three component system middle component 6 n=1 Tax=Acinetobacter pullicarnis TaxID=2576829 RepID=UPI00389944DE